jgi:hypothetical protein
MSYGPYYPAWIDATYDTDGNVVTPSPTPGTAAAFTWWDVNLALALPQSVKGDLVGFDGTAQTRVQVGTAGQVPTADPTAAVGWAWKTPSGGSAAAATGTFNVKDYGAVGNGTTDDTAAINSAIAAALAVGGRVLLAPGTYATTSVIDIPENVTLEGVHGDTVPYTTSPPPPCVIKPLNTHAGTAILRMRSKADTGRTYDHVGARVRNLTLDGTNTPTGTKGIQVAGLVREARFEYVTVNAVKDTSFWFGAGATDPAQPQSLRLIGCLAKASGNNGYTFTNVPDSTVIDCNALGSANTGFYIAGFMNGQLTNIRSEWNGQHGIYLTSGFWGAGQGSGGCILSSVTTDRNGFNGVFIDATGAGALQINGVVNRRDGRNNGTGGGGYAGLFVSTAATMPVIVDNLQVYPGVDDTGTGTNSPQVGVSATGANLVTISSGYVFAATTAIAAGTGLLVSPLVGTATGTGTAPVRVAPSGIAARSVYNVVSDYGADRTGVANAGTAIQNAINAASAAGGGIVYFPAGNYLISATLTMKSRVTLKGAGLNASTITQSSTTAAGVTATDQIDMTFEDLTVYGPASGTGTGLVFARSTASNVARIALRRIQVGGFGTAIDASNPITSTFDDVLVTNGTTGFYIHGVNGGAAGTSVSFVSTYATGFTQSGYKLDTMTYCGFQGTAADSCGIAYELIACQGISFSGCGTESLVNRSTNYPGIGWKLTGSVGISLGGCFTYSLPNNSIWVTGATASAKVGGFSENSPTAAAVNSIKVDAGCSAVLEAVSTVKPVSLATGTTSQIKVNGTSAL